MQVALERTHRTSLVGTLVGWPGAAQVERRQRAEADELIAFLGLGRYADALIGNLSTGTRRIAELACLLALDAPVLCLDEPPRGWLRRRPRPSARYCRRSGPRSASPCW